MRLSEIIGMPIDVGDENLPYNHEKKKAHQIGKSFSKNVYGSLSKEEKDSIEKYRDSAVINRYLRSGDLEHSDKSHAQLLDAAISKRTLDKTVVVYRSVGGKFAEDLFDKDIGYTFVDNGFVSTTLHKKYAFSGVFSNDSLSVIMKIIVPRGTNFLYASEIDEAEVEVILPRNGKFKVLKKEKGVWTHGTKRKYIMFTMSYTQNKQFTEAQKLDFNDYGTEFTALLN